MPSRLSTALRVILNGLENLGKRPASKTCSSRAGGRVGYSRNLRSSKLRDRRPTRSDSSSVSLFHEFGSSGVVCRG
jgi:hypothetical protein